MKTDELRLELVRLVHRHDWEPKRVVERAKELEAYVTGLAGSRPPPTDKAG